VGIDLPAIAMALLVSTVFGSAIVGWVSIEAHEPQRCLRRRRFSRTCPMWTLGTPALELVIRAALIYLVFFGALRLFGKREIGQFTLFDLALVLIAANALQPAITGPDASIPGGLIVIVTIFTLNRGVAALRVRSPLIRGLLEFGPTVVGRDGAWLLPVLVRQGLDLVDVEAALREHGLDAVKQMKLATLEADGSISIVAIETAGTAQIKHRQRRYRRPL
jgi:uncharacterized membrane protein YcaP (DUF421 family)